MRQMLVLFLLSAAVIFQGMGSVCACDPPMTDMGKQAMAGGHSMAMSHADAPSQHSKGCTGRPDGYKPGNDCLDSCAMPAGLPGVMAFAPRILPGEALLSPPKVSLMDFVQAPPTPPPIA